MDNGLTPKEPSEKPKKKRGRPPGSHKTTSPSAQQRVERGADVPTLEKTSGEKASSVLVMEQEDRAEELLAYTVGEEKLTPFSSVLRQILRRERSEVSRVARELDISDNTIYRWLNGSSEPRPAHLKRLLEVLPHQRVVLAQAINQTFGDSVDIQLSAVREVTKEIYYKVMTLAAMYEEFDTRFWHISQAIFEDMLLHLDIDRQGIAITFAKLLPPHEDGTHSLREVVMRGSGPWPHALSSKAYLGSTSLAGTAIAHQRMQIWDAGDDAGRTQVEIDEFEQSACAVPVMRGNLVSGALIVSSTQIGFFHDQLACGAVSEYALMLGIALSDQDFYHFSRINLRPMPPLVWQREQMAKSYTGRILNYAHLHSMSRKEAELAVQAEMELEFEDVARSMA